jgi:hypothetical protein
MPQALGAPKEAMEKPGPWPGHKRKLVTRTLQTSDVWSAHRLWRETCESLSAVLRNFHMQT